VTKERLDLATIFPELAQVRDAKLRGQVDALWQRLWSESRFERLEDVPVSSKIARPHLPHAQAVVRLAVQAADVADAVHAMPLDRDVLIAAAIAQDAGKLVEYEPAAGEKRYARTRLGTDLQHSVYAAHVALELGMPLDVVHIMLAHSPSTSLEPKSRECMVLFWIDQLDLSLLGERTWSRSLTHAHH
jgi:hypothetical protein